MVERAQHKKYAQISDGICAVPDVKTYSQPQEWLRVIQSRVPNALARLTRLYSCAHLSIKAEENALR
jgi:hypothetical protein